MSFVVYKSSAGSGKTFTLVKEYLKLVLSDNQKPPQKYKQILAITFTNKAATEMKERIINALKELTENKSGILIDILRDETGLDNDTLSKRAKNTLSSILHNYTDFAIGTIDSFVHKIVRSFAFDLKIPMNFEIEMDAERLISRAIDELISKIGTNEQLTRALVEFAESKTDEEKNWHIEKDLQQFASTLLNENGIIHIEKLKELTVDDFLKIRDLLNREIAIFESSIKKTAASAYQLIQQNNIALNTFYQGEKGIGAYFKNLAEDKFEKIIPNNYVISSVNDNKWIAGKISKDDMLRIDSIKEKLTQCFNSIQNIVEKDYKDYILFKLIRKNIYSLAVLNEIEKVIIEIKKEDNILHISEFNKIISKIVFEQPAPFIYERIGQKYQHYLIDEFQDTSVLQWQNLLPLLDNSLAYNNFNMLVGDGKQAIYRWRGGEVGQFSQLPNINNYDNNELVQQREQTFKNHFQEKKLNRNYRSRAGIIDFNNQFFKSISEKLNDENKTIYKEFEQEGKENSKEGYVSIHFLNDENSNQSACEKTLEIIKQNVTEGYELKEITILTRNNKEGNLITGYLIEKGIQVVSSESLLLKNSPTINFILSVLKYIQNNNDTVAKTNILEYLLKNNKLENQSLDTYINNLIVSKTNRPFSEFLNENDYAINTLSLLKIPLYELCEEIIRLFGLNKKNDPHLVFFLDEVFNYYTKKNNNVADFVDWWETQKEKSSIVISEGTNAVNVMTIHKSKGLEFPIIIMPFTNWTNSQNNENIWINLTNHAKLAHLKSALIPVTSSIEETDFSQEYFKEKNKQLLDNVNLLYVAMTRPIEQLYIITTPPKGLKNISKFFIDFLTEDKQWNEKKNVYEYGIKPERQIKKSEKNNTRELSKINSTYWRRKVVIQTRSKKHEHESKKDYGIIVHELLAKIKTKDDIEGVVTKAFYSGRINEKEKELLSLKLHRLVAHPLLKDYFKKNWSFKLESEILLPNGETYRPDRVVIEEQKATVIDYKTGEAKEEHKKQLDKYEELLKILGYTKITKLLVYFEEEKIEIV